MKISLNWLKEYIPDLNIDSINSLINNMVSIGLDIESVENESDIYNKFIIGEVIEKQMHPNATRLSLCKVNVGGKVLDIVCGAPNVTIGQKVCVALEKAIIPNGGFEIKKSKIRGKFSEGMICSEKELNLSEKHDEILVLNGDARVGENFAEYAKANDHIFEIGITPNRGDLFSHIGIAREVAALFDNQITIPSIRIKESETYTSDLIKIRIDNIDLCKRFTGRVIRNVKIIKSPEWLQRRLKSIGLRPRNNIVDITNFVMLETGQPLHAFDYDKIRGKEIIVQTAKESDKFITLDSKERILNSNSLMVCDSEGYSGIAGIMGGQSSEITENTKNVFIESAYFDPVSVRKNSKRLNLQTDASQRFERGVDINMVEYASLRAAQLIQELAGGEISKDLLDEYPEKFEKIHISLRLSKISEVLGIELTEKEVSNLLKKIEIIFYKREDDKLIYEIPEFRRIDLQGEIDLIEEVARIYKYDNIPESTRFKSNLPKLKHEESGILNLINETTNHFIGRGFNQILTNPLIDDKKFKDFTPKTVKLINSISADMNSLRTNLTHGMLDVIRNNFNYSGKDISLKLFEIGRVFFNEDDKFREEELLLFALSGSRDNPLSFGNNNLLNVLDIKGEVEMYLSKLNLDNFTYFYYNNNKVDEIKIDVNLDSMLIGNINMIDNKLKAEFDIESNIYLAQFNLNMISKYLKKGELYNEISKYPAIKRDLSLVLDKNITYVEVKDTILKSGGHLVKDLKLFDLYYDEKLGLDKKSIGISMEFSSMEKTLTDEEINPLMDKIIIKLEKELGVKLRI